jgi:hypothetical protein
VQDKAWKPFGQPLNTFLLAQSRNVPYLPNRNVP